MIVDPTAVICIANGLAGLHEQLAHYRKFKYLYYLPGPVHLKPLAYDLVADETFCSADDRLPLLIRTQFGIFPTSGSYPGQCTRNYRALEGMASQHIGLIRRAYLSNREDSFIYVFPTKNFKSNS